MAKVLSCNAGKGAQKVGTILPLSYPALLHRSEISTLEGPCVCNILGKFPALYGPHLTEYNTAAWLEGIDTPHIAAAGLQNLQEPQLPHSTSESSWKHHQKIKYNHKCQNNFQGNFPLYMFAGPYARTHFTIDESGEYDIPAAIDKVLDVTRHRDLQVCSLEWNYWSIIFPLFFSAIFLNRYLWDLAAVMHYLVTFPCYFPLQKRWYWCTFG